MILKKLNMLMAILAVLALGVGTAFAIPIDNASFEAGNTGFISEYLYFDVPATPANSYSSPKASLYDEGTYGVGTDPSKYHVSWSPVVAHSGQNMMIVNGDTVAGTKVWGVPETGSYSVDLGDTYYFGAWLTSIYPQIGADPIAPATLQFSINGNLLGSAFQLSAAVGTWELFYEPWVADSNTAVISLVNANVTAGGNDFALDDITFSKRIPTVPEPATMLLLGSGLLGLAGLSRKKLKK